LNRDIFSILVSNPGRISTADIPSLDVFAEQFPYCQLAHFFAAKPHFDLLTVQAEGKVQRAAIHAVSRYKLKRFLEIPIEHTAADIAYTGISATQPEQKDTTLIYPAEIHTAPSPIDQLLAQADLSTLPLTEQEKTSEALPSLLQATDIDEKNLDSFNEKIKKLKQTEIIDHFIKTEPRISSLSTFSKEPPTKDMSEQSIKAPPGLVSENLANIMIKQGKTDKAIEIYEKLIVKFPEKKSYFAEKIESLRNN
jgi:tetratricopeptide (TPR) repeat protein